MAVCCCCIRAGSVVVDGQREVRAVLSIECAVDIDVDVLGGWHCCNASAANICSVVLSSVLGVSANEYFSSLPPSCSPEYGVVLYAKVESVQPLLSVLHTCRRRCVSVSKRCSAADPTDDCT